VFAAILVASCQPAGILDPQGPIASANRLLLNNSTAIMLLVVVPVIVATLAFAWVPVMDEVWQLCRPKPCDPYGRIWWFWMLRRTS
jgi:hypothetical protein